MCATPGGDVVCAYESWHNDYVPWSAIPPGTVSDEFINTGASAGICFENHDSWLITPDFGGSIGSATIAACRDIVVPGLPTQVAYWYWINSDASNSFYECKYMVTQ